MQELLTWKPSSDPKDTINSSQVHKKARMRDNYISDCPKVQLIANTTSKEKRFNVLGSDISKLYAFRHWDFIDQFIYWDGPIPSVDIIESAHRHGVSVLGTIFYNWSNSIQDQLLFLKTLEEDSKDSQTFPFARKLVDIAKHYGFDGYFINQETTGSLLAGYGVKMRAFLLYLKNYSHSVDYELEISWYDAMGNDGFRDHQDEVNEYNDLFLIANSEGVTPADYFFINFNWNEDKNKRTQKYLKSIQRSPYDAYAGFELQQNTYNTRIDYQSLLNVDGSLRLSLGLFAADSILGVSKNAIDFHRQEDFFWTGISTETVNAINHWIPISNFITPHRITYNGIYNTFYCVGHGKYWYLKGVLSSDNEWNNRALSDTNIYFEPSSDYDINITFEDAFHGGSSLALQIKDLDKENILVPITRFDYRVENLEIEYTLAIKSKLEDTYELIFEDQHGKHYLTDHFVVNANGWNVIEGTVSLSPACTSIHRVYLKIKPNHKLTQSLINVGWFRLKNKQIERPEIHNAQFDEIYFKDNHHASAYLKVIGKSFSRIEVYALKDNRLIFINGSNGDQVYLPSIIRNNPTETVQKLIVRGYNDFGHSTPNYDLYFDWFVESDETLSSSQDTNPNLAPTAKIHSCSQQEQAELAENILTGTISGTSDKWVSLKPDPNEVIVDFGYPQKVSSMILEHAGVGGESVDDGRMNTNTFEILVTNSLDEPFQSIYTKKDNVEHQTNIDLSVAIEARYWKLFITKGHGGTPWGAVRLYNWKFYEKPLSVVPYLPLSQTMIVKNMKEENYILVNPLYDQGRFSLYQGTKEIDQVKLTDGISFIMCSPLENLQDIAYIIEHEGLISKKIVIPEQIVKIDTLKFDIEYTFRAVYSDVDPLPLENKTLTIKSEGLYPKTIEVPLTHPSITKHCGQLYWLDYPLNVKLVKVNSIKEAIKSIQWHYRPRNIYYSNEEIELKDANIKVTYKCGHEDIVTLEEASIDGLYQGTPTILIEYFGHTLTLDITYIDQVQMINLEKLEQKVTEAKIYLAQKSIENNDELSAMIAEIEQKINKKLFNTQGQVNEYWETLDKMIR